MRKLPGLILIYILIIVISSCKKDEIEEAPKIACPIFVLEGPEYIWTEIGKSWNEPGFHCSEYEEGGDDLTNSVIVDNSKLNVDSSGVYVITYTAVNKLGCKKSITRWVMVHNGHIPPPWDIEGSYSKSFGTQTMNVSRSQIESIYDIEQIFDESLGLISGRMVDFGGLEYHVFQDFFITINNRDLYYKGIAQYDTALDSITFYISTYYYDDDSHYANYIVTWYRSE